MPGLSLALRAVATSRVAPPSKAMYRLDAKQQVAQSPISMPKAFTGWWNRKVRPEPVTGAFGTRPRAQPDSAPTWPASRNWL